MKGIGRKRSDVAKKRTKKFLNAKRRQKASLENLTLKQVYLLEREFNVKLDFDGI